MMTRHLCAKSPRGVEFRLGVSAACRRIGYVVWPASMTVMPRHSERRSSTSRTISRERNRRRPNGGDNIFVRAERGVRPRSGVLADGPSQGQQEGTAIAVAVTTHDPFDCEPRRSMSFSSARNAAAEGGRAPGDRDTGSRRQLSEGLNGSTGVQAPTFPRAAQIALAVTTPLGREPHNISYATTPRANTSAD